MRRNCERPGCAEVASIAFGMIPEDLLVWLEAVDPATLGEPRPGLLCRRHADAMVVPVGWMLDDRREPAPRLFRPPARRAESVDASGPMRRPRIVDPETPPLFGDETSATAEDTAVDTADDTADANVAYTPVFDTSDDLDGLLNARSPLLSKAFRLDRRPRGES